MDDFDLEIQCEEIFYDDTIIEEDAYDEDLNYFN